MSIFDKYDLSDVCEDFTIPTRPVSGNVLVVGSSGSGKSTILKSWGMVDFKYDQNIPIIDLFVSELEGESSLISAGLRSVPCWLRSLSSVSNGERHRAEIALNISYGRLVIDEFTSLVDRNTARSLCVSINKANLNGLTLATCHRDVSEWLDFDHIYDTDAQQWLDRGLLRRSREVKLSIEACDTKKIWRIFQKHHYLSGKINPSASCWMALIGGEVVAMSSVIAFPNGNWKNGWREHRTVVLPEFQGMGIGSALSDAVADYIISTGARYFSKTSHPAFGYHRNNSDKWRATSKNGKKRKDYTLGRSTKEDGHKLKHANRACFSHEYIG